MIARLVTFIFGLAFASSCLAADEQSDAQLTKLMVGAWRSPRHDKFTSQTVHGGWAKRNLACCTAGGASEIIALKAAAPMVTNQAPTQAKAVSRFTNLRNTRSFLVPITEWSASGSRTWTSRGNKPNQTMKRIAARSETQFLMINFHPRSASLSAAIRLSF